MKARFSRITTLGALVLMFFVGAAAYLTAASAGPKITVYESPT